jgi:hypothetical protein
MKKTTRVTLAMVVLAGLCMGCGKSEEQATAPAQATTTETWEPETVALPEGHSADDGHDHGGHNHQDHAGHNH